MFLDKENKQYELSNTLFWDTRPDAVDAEENTRMLDARDIATMKLDTCFTRSTKGFFRSLSFVS